MIVYLLRHARAGKRAEWEGDDSLRPLDERGRLQAERLVEQLAGREFQRILSSRYTRCVQSVEPLAAARGLAVEEDEALTEGSDAAAALAALRAVGEPVVACVHGDLCAELLGERTRKGSTTILELENDSVTVLEQLEPPPRPSRRPKRSPEGAPVQTLPGRLREPVRALRRADAAPPRTAALLQEASWLAAARPRIA